MDEAFQELLDKVTSEELDAAETPYEGDKKVWIQMYVRKRWIQMKEGDGAKDADNNS